MSLLVRQYVGYQCSGLDIAAVPPGIRCKPNSDTPLSSKRIDALAAGKTIDGWFDRRIGKGVIAGCNATCGLEIDYRTIGAKPVSLYKLFKDLLQLCFIFPYHVCLLHAAPEPAGMAREIKEVPAVPSGYLVNTVPEKKTPVIRADKCLILREKLTVKIYYFHILKFTFCRSGHIDLRLFFPAYAGL